jgi:dihydroorotase
MRFDLLIRGGEVVDPGGPASGRLDVGISRDRIAAVAPEIPEDAAREVIDASGLIVTPGLVDLHTHAFRGIGYWGVNADVVASTSGVTTWLDVGSSGAMTLAGFRDYVVSRSAVRILAFLNISYLGLIGPDFELTNLDFCDVDIFERIANLNRDLVLGVKVRIGTTTVGANQLEPMHRALEAAARCELPLMVHISEGPPEIDEVLRLMRPGDIVTHCFTGLNMKLTDDDGRPRREALEARERGVVMDIGHGAGSLSFETAEALLASGFRPDTISTDIHQLSIRGPMYDLPTCMTKFLAFGWSLPEVVAATTIRPAEIMGLAREIGQLAPGARADLALFELESGRFPLHDISGATLYAEQRLTHARTIVGGRPLARREADPPAPWVEPGRVWPDFQASLVDRQQELLDAAPAKV